MSIFDKIRKNFISEEDNINQSHLRNFFLIAISGGEISDKDYMYIENLGIELKLSKTLIYEVFNAGGTIQIHLPKHNFIRNKNICDYILFAHRNGEISNEEKKVCKIILLTLTNIKQERGDKVLDEIINIVMSGKTIDGLTYDQIGRVIGLEYLNQMI